MPAATQSSYNEDDVQFVYGKANRPSTPIRTVINGVYGTVAEYELGCRTTTITSQKTLERKMKPSRGHTRASTMANEKVLQSTLTAEMMKQASAKDFFTLNKFKKVESRVSKNHTNDKTRNRNCTTIAM